MYVCMYVCVCVCVCVRSIPKAVSDMLQQEFPDVSRVERKSHNIYRSEKFCEQFCVEDLNM
jgi:hypothetical protein